MNVFLFRIVLVFGLFVVGHMAEAQITFSPYYSVRSTKSINPGETSDTEDETVKQKEEKGIRAGLRLGRLFKLTLGVGQSFSEATTKTNTVVDEFDEIDYSQDLNSTTVGKEKKLKEWDNRARFSFHFDPSFAIFILKLKLGVTAKQRITELLIEDELHSRNEPDPTYNPHAGVGFGLRFTRQMFWLAEYSLDFYKFPETEPFERELTVSFGFSI